MAEVRIGHLEREQASRLLGEHYALGRLDHDEYAERLDAAWTARTRRDLAHLFADLPRLPVSRPTPPATVTRRDRLHWSRVPGVPLLLVGLVLSVATGQPWWIPAVVWWVAARGHQARARAEVAVAARRDRLAERAIRGRVLG